MAGVTAGTDPRRRSAPIRRGYAAAVAEGIENEVQPAAGARAGAHRAAGLDSPAAAAIVKPKRGSNVSGFLIKWRVRYYYGKRPRHTRARWALMRGRQGKCGRVGAKPAW